jgi:hypothetical protein
LPVPASSQRVVASHSVPVLTPPEKAPVVVTTKYDPVGEMSTSRMNVGKLGEQLLRTLSNRFVCHGATTAGDFPVSSTAICERTCPPTVEKLPTATRLVPSAETSNRLTFVAPPRAGS